MEIKDNLLKYADIPFSYSIISLVVSPFLRDDSIKSLLILSLLSGIVASTLEAFNPVKRILFTLFDDTHSYIMFTTNEKNPEPNIKLDKYILRAFEFSPVNKLINKISAYTYLSILLVVVSNYIYYNDLFILSTVTHLTVFILLLLTIAILYSIKTEISSLPQIIFISAYYLVALSGIIDNLSTSKFDQLKEYIFKDDWTSALHVISSGLNNTGYHVKKGFRTVVSESERWNKLKLISTSLFYY